MFDFETEKILSNLNKLPIYYTKEEKNKIIFKSHYHNFFNIDVRKPKYICIDKKEWKTIYNICKYIFSDGNLAIHFNFYFETQKWLITDIIRVLLYKAKNGCSYKTLENIFNIPKSTLNNAAQLIKKLKIFSQSYSNIIKKYYGKRFINKLKFRSTDTSAIVNKGCTENIKYNRHYGRKKIIKISTENDSFGIPISLKVVSGNKYDGETYREQIKEKRYIDQNLDNKTRKYLMADSGYDDNKTIEEIKNQNFHPIIKQNIRNTKDPRKIRKLSYREKEIYPRRTKIENNFCKIKSYKDVNVIYYKKISSYINILELIFIYNLTSLMN